MVFKVFLNKKLKERRGGNKEDGEGAANPLHEVPGDA